MLVMVMLSARVSAATAARSSIAILRGTAGHFVAFGAFPIGAAGHRFAIFAACFFVLATAGSIFGVFAAAASH
jgi:hypothetical protein